MDELQDLPTISWIKKLNIYFDTSPPPKTPRPTADITELFHIAFLANLDATIARVFRMEGGRRKPMKELDGNWLFFYTMTPYFESESNAAAVKLYESIRLYRTCELTTIIRGTEPWPFRLVVQVADAYHTYRPKSDFLLLMNLLPCLIVEANSTSSGPPQDRYRMLIQGASIVRFANSFVKAYSTDNSFILVAVFVNDNGEADRYLLFQSEDGDEDEEEDKDEEDGDGDDELSSTDQVNACSACQTRETCLLI